MRKISALLLALLLTLSMLSAYTDSFSSFSERPGYIELIDAVKNNEEENAADELYRTYMAQELTMCEKARIEYHMARYYKDKGNTEEAKRHVELGKEYLAAIEESEGELFYRTAQADIVSADYYVNGGISKGMESSDLMKELYKDYPDEYYIALQEAFRLLYTPAIAGGSSRKALSILNDIEKEMDGLSKLDLFSFYSAKGMALSQRDEYDESDSYLDEAESIYTGDPAIEDIRKDNRRGRRNSR